MIERGAATVGAMALAVLVATSAMAQSSAPLVAPPDVVALRARSAALTPAQQAQARTLFSSAFKLWQAGDFQAAELGFEQGLRIDPANGAANYYYGDTLQRRGDPKARTYMAFAAALAPSTPEGLKAQVFLQDQAQGEQAKAQADQKVADVVSRYAAVLPGKWKIKSDWFLSSTFTLTLRIDSNGKPQSTGFAYEKFQNGEFQGDDLLINFRGCRLMMGCDLVEYRFHLVSPTRMEGTQVWSGGSNLQGPAHAEKTP